MYTRYSETCALAVKKGVCYQCVELDGFFKADNGNPLSGLAHDIDARTQILIEMRDKRYDHWHRLLFELLDDLA